MTDKTLSKAAIKRLMRRYPEWSLNAPGTKLTTTIKFDKHATAMVFLVRLSIQAEVLGHHPDVLFSHAKLKITTTTHGLKGLSQNDVDMMAKVEHLKSVFTVDDDVDK